MTTPVPEQPVDPNAVLMGGGGAPSAKFEQPGDTVDGVVLCIEQEPEREWDPVAKRSTGEPKRYPSGDIIYQVVAHLQTTLRDPQVEDDDGERRVYIAGKRMKKTIADAVRATGANGLEVGGRLSVTFIGVDPDSYEGKAKVYQAAYNRPDQQAPRQEPNGTSHAAPANPAAQQPSPSTAPQSTPDAAPQSPVGSAPQQANPAQLDPDQLAQIQAMLANNDAA